MCTPLMAQRCLLHHAALATGFACSLCRSAPVVCELTREEWDELIALGVAKDNGGDVFDVLVHAYAPALHLRGHTLITGCWEELWWTCKETLGYGLGQGVSKNHCPTPKQIRLLYFYGSLSSSVLECSSDKSLARQTSQPYLYITQHSTAAQRNPNP